MTSSFIPLSVPCLKGNELKYLTDCIETNWVSSVGPYVKRFEEEIARYLGVDEAAACVNGTAALHLATLLSGVGPEEEVIVPTLTFIAPVNAVRYVGAHPVFMDCDDRMNLDPEKLESFLKEECAFRNGKLINRRTGRRIGALIVVHVFGHPVHLEPILQLCRAFGLKLIEDATESIGSYYKEVPSPKRQTGTIGDFGCFSFNGNKLITTGGGGMLIARDRKDIERARHLSTQAKEDELYFKHDAVGYNYRLTNLQAAVGVAQLEQLDRFIEVKRRNFEKYRQMLEGVKGLRFIAEPAGTFSNYWHYPLVAEGEGRRDRLMASLKENRIESRPLWALIHRQKPYRGCQAYRIERAPRYEATALNIPCSIGLKEEEMQRVAEVLKDHFRAS